MNRNKAILLLGFLVVFAAGAAVSAVGVARHYSPPPDRHDLANELDLTPKQKDQMRDIWSEAMKHRPEPGMWAKFDKERDDKIRAFLTEEQKPLFEQALRERQERDAQAHKEMDAVFHDAEEKTRQILTEEQLKKFDKIRKDHGGRRPPFFGPRHGPGPGPGGPGGPEPRTRPAEPPPP